MNLDLDDTANRQTFLAHFKSVRYYLALFIIFVHKMCCNGSFSIKLFLDYVAQIMVFYQDECYERLIKILANGSIP